MRTPSHGTVDPTTLTTSASKQFLPLSVALEQTRARNLRRTNLIDQVCNDLDQ